MKQQNIINIFKDAPEPEQWEMAIDIWRDPDSSCNPAAYVIPHSPKKEKKTLINWLYNYIRLNVKRGRIFDLREVLQTSQADCLGYAKLFTVLGRGYGLDVGVVEVIIDNRGYNVPHTAVLVKLTSGKNQFIDLWHGSLNIRHKRLGLQVKRQGTWKIEDIDYPDMKKVEDISYLPDNQVDAITLYIEGNRSLKEGDYSPAIERYTQAIRLYPQNARIYYNRAIAYEILGQPDKAEADYALALRDVTALKRTLATQPQDVVDLIKLDEKGIPETNQNIYLLHRGFITGKPVYPDKIALKLGISQKTITGILSSIKRTLDE